jgi:Ca-activated chloride channel family protein
MLILLLVAPLFIMLYLRLQRKRQQVVARYGGLGLIRGAQNTNPGARRHIPFSLFLAGLTILMVAMARPQATVNLPRVEGTVILAFDVSGSMAADDMQPNRMEAAKAAAREFVLSQPSTVQIGVVAFSDSGLNVQAPVSEQETVLAAIDRLSPQRGTSIANGIIASLNTIAIAMGEDVQAPALPADGDVLQDAPKMVVPGGEYPSAVIVLLTDGENNVPPDPFAAALAAAEHKVRIFTIGIGSAAGAILHIEGFTVHSQLNEPALQQISQLTGGAYFNAQTEQDLQKIYDGLTPQLVVKPEKMEVTSLFAGASILFLLAGGLFSLFWFSRLP